LIETIEIDNQNKQKRQTGEKYCFIYSGGGFGFYTENTDGCFMSVLEWSKCLDIFHTTSVSCGKKNNNKNKKKWDLIGFDCCLFSMLESIYQLRHLTKYILACETYEPYQGFNSVEMVNAFANCANKKGLKRDGKKGLMKKCDDKKDIIHHPLSTKEIGKIIISSFINRVNKDDTADPADMVLIKPSSKLLDKLLANLNFLFPSDKGEKFPLSFNNYLRETKETTRIDNVPGDENGYFDLWSTVLKKQERKLVLKKQGRVLKKPEQVLKKIKNLLRKIIVDYQASKKQEASGKQSNGISFCGIFTLDKFLSKEDYFNLDIHHFF
jgi:hypothetical protein